MTYKLRKNTIQLLFNIIIFLIYGCFCLAKIDKLTVWKIIYMLIYKTRTQVIKSVHTLALRC